MYVGCDSFASPLFLTFYSMIFLKFIKRYTFFPLPLTSTQIFRPKGEPVLYLHLLFIDDMCLQFLTSPLCDSNSWWRHALRYSRFQARPRLLPTSSPTLSRSRTTPPWPLLTSVACLVSTNMSSSLAFVAMQTSLSSYPMPNLVNFFSTPLTAST